MTRHLDGLGRYTLGLVDALLRRPADVEVHVLVASRRSADHPLAPVLDRHRPAVTECDADMFSPWAQVRVPATVSRVSPAVYHYPHFNLPFAVPGRVVATIHDLTPLTQPDWFRTGRVYKRVYFRVATAWTVRRSAAVIAPSDATAAEVRRLFGHEARVVTIPEGVDAAFGVAPDAAMIEDMRRRHGLARRFILYVGVDRPHKNLARLLGAYAAITDRIEHDLVLVGRDVTRTGEIDAAIERYGIRERVHRLGYLDEQDLRAAYAAADAFALCSLREGFGLPVLEAMKAGVPVVTSRSGPTAEVAGDAAVLVDPLSTDSIAEGLRAVCSDPHLRDRLRRTGLKRASDFTWERAAERTIDVYRSVAG